MQDNTDQMQIANANKSPRDQLIRKPKKNKTKNDSPIN